METKDLQKFAYLYLCSTRDKKLLLGKEKMKYCDFRRLTYLAEYMGLHELDTVLWEEHGKDFQKQMDALEEIQEEMKIDRDYYTDLEYSMREQAGWVKDFLKESPFAVRRWLQEYAARNDPNWGTFEEIWEGAMSEMDSRKGKQASRKRKNEEKVIAEV